MLWAKLIRGITVRHIRLFGRGYDDYDYQVHVDPTNEGLSIMDPVHVNAHKGILYEAQHSGSAIDAGNSIEALLQLDPKYPVHIRLSLKSSGPSQLFLFEVPTFSGAGTAVTAVNRNRRVWAPAAHTAVTHTPTLTGDGTQLSSAPEYGTTGPPGKGDVGGESEGFNEWVLREGFDYLIRLTNTHASAAHALWMSLIFYEQELKL